MSTLSRLLAAGLLSLSVGAVAQPPEPPMRGAGAPGVRPPFHGQRGPIKRTDLQAMLETSFDRLDANHDGKLTPEDRDLLRSQRRDQTFSRLDANKDGTISKDEFLAAAGGARPGAGARATGPGGPGRHGMMRHAAMMRGMGGPGGAMGGPQRAWMRDPVNQPVTRTAFVEHGLALFDKADKDHDGTISPAERDAARGPMRERPMRGHMPPPPPQGK